MAAHSRPRRLEPQPWMLAPETRRLIAALETGGAPVRFVGGCVRNALLGLAVEDVDLATPAEPALVIRLAEAAGLRAVPTGLDHGTVTLLVDHAHYEVTTLRRDVATDGRRAVVAYTRDWAEDAARRDFTMNALYADPDGTIHDFVGGLVDLEARRVRFIGAPADRIAEDYLRILRFFRMHAWYGMGALDSQGLDACRAAASGLDRLSAERIQKELLRLLAAPDPVASVRAMAAAGVLAHVLPEARLIDRLAGLVAIENEALFVPGDAVLRLAALLPLTPDTAEAAAQRLRLSERHGERLRALAVPHPPLQASIEPGALRRLLYARGAETVLDLILLRWAEAPEGPEAVAWRALRAIASTWQRPVMPLQGRDVLAHGVPAGPEIGRHLAALEAWWIEADFPDDRAALLARLKARLSRGAE